MLEIRDLLDPDGNLCVKDAAVKLKAKIMETTLEKPSAAANASDKADSPAMPCSEKKPVIIRGRAICHGADLRWSSLPIINLPPNTIKVRRRIRNDRFASVFVKTKTEVQHWRLCPVGDKFNGVTELYLDLLQGVNAFSPNS